MHPIAHFKTITKHRNLVCKYCFRLGLYRQGLTHDLSKYSFTEFFRGAKYYQGYRSPNDAERLDTGISLAWLHHKGRNRHHLEYWIDYNLSDQSTAPDKRTPMVGHKIPIRYVAEMFCDRLAAAKIYLKEKYAEDVPLNYYVRSKPYLLVHPETSEELEKMLRVLKDEGEDAAFAYIRKRLEQEY